MAVLPSENNVKGIKASKKRITIVLACSMTGEKVTPLIIGKYAKPRCLNSLKEYPTLYKSNSNAWMTTQ